MNIEELKAKYGNRLKIVTISISEDEKYEFAVVRPSRHVIMAMASKKDDLEAANEILIKNCVQGGDMDALEDAAVYTKMIETLGEMIAGAQAFIKNA